MYLNAFFEPFDTAIVYFCNSDAFEELRRNRARNEFKKKTTLMEIEKQHESSANHTLWLMHRRFDLRKINAIEKLIQRLQLT